MPSHGTLPPVDLRAVCLVRAIVLCSQTDLCWMCVSREVPSPGTLPPVDLWAVCLVHPGHCICKMSVSEHLRRLHTQALKYLHRGFMSRAKQKSVKVTSPWRHRTCYTLHCLALLLLFHHAPPHTRSPMPHPAQWETEKQKCSQKPLCGKVKTLTEAFVRENYEIFLISEVREETQNVKVSLCSISVYNWKFGKFIDMKCCEDFHT